ncbi:MAG: chorismate synthase [Actinobacteria bacterium]|nr:chorismate synthase [Actinomycetota bacterium]
MRFLTAGESHGKYLTAIISEYPSGVQIDKDYIDEQLAKRQAGFGRGTRMSIERDKVKIISGVSSGVSTGAPICLFIENLDWQNSQKRIENEKDILNPRPGHADLTGYLKYRGKSIRDVIERSSARETAARVAVGGFAGLLLGQFGVSTAGFTEQIGTISIDLKSSPGEEMNPAKQKKIFEAAEKSILRCPDKKAEQKMVSLIKQAAGRGDTLGGTVKIISSGIVPGLGSYIQWDQRLDSRIAAAVMSIPSVKAVGFGAGFSSGKISGTSFHDEIFYEKSRGFYRKQNNAGGIEGGMSNGQNIEITAAVKPIPTTNAGLKTVNIKSKETEISLKERSDVCAVPAVSVIAAAAVNIELANAYQYKFGADNIVEMTDNFNNYKRYLDNI